MWHLLKTDFPLFAADVTMFSSFPFISLNHLWTFLQNTIIILLIATIDFEEFSSAQLHEIHFTELESIY